MMEFRPGIRNIQSGAMVSQPQSAVAATWYDPNAVIVSGGVTVWAYRAINSAGSPWLGGPTTYAASKVNEANPGTGDLIDGNGAVPWAQATGWSFNELAAQYLIGVVPDNQYSMFIEFDSVSNQGWLCGIFTIAPSQRFDIAPNNIGTRVVYGAGDAGARNLVVPQLLSGNLGIVDKQPYRNGATDGVVIPAGVGTFTLPMLIGWTAGLSHITGNIRAFVMYDDANPALIATQAAAIDTAMGEL